MLRDLEGLPAWQIKHTHPLLDASSVLPFCPEERETLHLQSSVYQWVSYSPSTLVGQSACFFVSFFFLSFFLLLQNLKVQNPFFYHIKYRYIHIYSKLKNLFCNETCPKVDIPEKQETNATFTHKVGSQTFPVSF